MRRYISKPDEITHVIDDVDVVVAGGGLSGLYTALMLDERLSVAVMVKSGPEQCNSYLAQGGIAASIHAEDTPHLHFRDTMRAGAGLSDVQAANILAQAGPAEIEKMMEMGVQFDKDKNGKPLVTCEGAHRKKRVLHCGGDATGKVIMDRMIMLAARKKNIKIFYDHFITDILTTEEGGVSGVITFHNDFQLWKAPFVVLATGGAGQVYRFTTNDPVSTGDGIAVAARAGALLADMEFVQFHPTAFYNPEGKDAMFLISEAVRGEGAVLRNHKGIAFMEKRHRLKDLAPRDIVAREIFNQMEKSDKPHVWLDVTHHKADFLRQRFPTIYHHCEKHGILPEKDFIPVVPAQHYLMGGVQTNTSGETTVPGLYACGEASCTGVHGANRLASNSLLECVVFGSRIAQVISGKALKKPSITGKPAKDKVDDRVPGNDLRQETIEAMESQPNARKSMPEKENTDNGQKKNLLVASEIKTMMSAYGSIVRNPEGLIHVIEYLNVVLQELEHKTLQNAREFELLNMATVGREILLAALASRESHGSHFLDEDTEESVSLNW